MVYEQALRENPADSEVTRRCAELALELERFTDAEHHLKILLDQVANESTTPASTADMADVEDLMGQCYVKMAQYMDAERFFKQVLEHDPHRVACYDRLARLRRVVLRRNEAADRTINRDGAKSNPKSGLAYLYRWRYAGEFTPPADAGDLTKAVELAARGSRRAFGRREPPATRSAMRLRPVSTSRRGSSCIRKTPS